MVAVQIAVVRVVEMTVGIDIRITDGFFSDGGQNRILGNPKPQGQRGGDNLISCEIDVRILDAQKLLVLIVEKCPLGCGTGDGFLTAENFKMTVKAGTAAGCARPCGTLYRVKRIHRSGEINGNTAHNKCTSL